MNNVNSKHKLEFSEKINQQSENSIWPEITNIISIHTSRCPGFPWLQLHWGFKFHQSVL